MATRSTAPRTRRAIAQPVPVHHRRSRRLRRLFAVGLFLLLVAVAGWGYLLHVYAPGLRAEARNVPVVVQDQLAQYGAPYTPRERISPHLRHAIVAIEDRRFYLHPGIDPVSLLRAVWMRFAQPDIDPGGSTLEAQLAKRTIVGHDLSLHGRLRTFAIAWAIDQDFSKPRVLEMYLNSAYFGRGAYGAEEAARTYFGTHAANLTIAQAAYLAALPQAPSVYSVHPTGAAITRRWKVVLQDMLSLGYISPAEARAAENTPLVFALPAT